MLKIIAEYVLSLVAAFGLGFIFGYLEEQYRLWRKRRR